MRIASRSSSRAPGIKAAAIHGNKSQAARVKALEMFKKGQITALVATEVAARGLDIKELPHVVNYELPNIPEDYVHRIGRTGRAGAGGVAVSLVSSDETGYLRDIERVLRRSIPVLPTPEFKIVESAPAPAGHAARPAQGRGGYHQGALRGSGGGERRDSVARRARRELAARRQPAARPLVLTQRQLAVRNGQCGVRARARAPYLRASRRIPSDRP